MRECGGMTTREDTSSDNWHAVNRDKIQQRNVQTQRDIGKGSEQFKEQSGGTREPAMMRPRSVG